MKGVMPAFVHYRGVPQLFMRSMVESYRAGVFQHPYTEHTSARINAARTANGEAFLLSDAEWIFYIDTDMVWTPEDIIKLSQFAKKRGAKAVSGWALVPKNGLWPNAYREDNHGYVPWGDIRPGSEPLKVDAVGGSCFLVHREVMEAVKENYQGRTAYLWQEETYNAFYDQQTGEDIEFSRRIGEAGFNIWYHPGAIFTHLKTQTLEPKHYVQFQEELAKRLQTGEYETRGVVE